MNTDRRGFAPIAIALIVIVGIAVLGGVFYYFHSRPSTPSPIVNNPTPIASSTTPTSTGMYLSPSTGSVGTVITIYGSGFATAGNTVLVDGMVAASLESIPSSDGNTITFTMPQTVGPVCKSEMCAQYLVDITSGVYAISVVTNNVAQNIGSFTVVATSSATSTPSAPYRSYLTPSSGAVGTMVTIHGSGFAPTGNQVTLDGMVDGSLNDLPSPDGKTIIFAVPTGLGPNCKPDQACPMYLRVVTAGSYTVGVISNGATYNIGTFTVIGGGLQQPTPQS